MVEVFVANIKEVGYVRETMGPDKVAGLILKEYPDCLAGPLHIIRISLEKTNVSDVDESEYSRLLIYKAWR